MRTFVGFVLVLLASVTANAAWPADRNPRLIVPGERIGSAYLGMPRSMIDAINHNSLCPVIATYNAAGDSTRLETNWGGGCLVSDEIQVGLPFGPADRAFGRPDKIAKDVLYLHAAAVWVVYESHGIAFRVLGWHSGTTIQAIAVFPEVAARVSGRNR